jgi:hypothetical protein
MNHHMVYEFITACRRGDHDKAAYMLDRGDFPDKSQHDFDLLKIALNNEIDFRVIDLLCKYGYKITNRINLLNLNEHRIIKILLTYDAFDSNMIFRYHGHQIDLSCYIALWYPSLNYLVKPIRHFVYEGCSLFGLIGISYLKYAPENDWIIPPCSLITNNREINIDNHQIAALYTFIFVFEN